MVKKVSRRATKLPKEVFYIEIEFYGREDSTSTIKSMFGPYQTKGAARGQLKREGNHKFKVVNSWLITGKIDEWSDELV